MMEIERGATPILDQIWKDSQETLNPKEKNVETQTFPYRTEAQDRWKIDALRPTAREEYFELYSRGKSIPNNHYLELVI